MVVAKGSANESLGSWSGGDFGNTVRSSAGVGADSDLPPSVRFLAGVSKLIRRRISIQASKADPAQPAVFLLAPNDIDSLEAPPKRVPMLDNGLTQVAGRLWFVNPVVVSGKYVEIASDDDDQLFTLITDQIGLGDAPAVVFDPRTAVPTVRFYSSGLSHPDICETVSINHAHLSLQEIYEVIGRVHAECLVTPEAQVKAGKLWELSSKGWAASNAEDVIQLYLRTGLTTAFPTCTVRHEQTGVPGRLDLEIEQADPLNEGAHIRHAVLELKVLRSFGSTGNQVTKKETLEWVSSGVLQAAAYRDDRGALLAALCCFDMRAEDTGQACFDHVRDNAANLNVDLKAWHIFRSSARYRQRAGGGQ